jgi:hypothetical protein
MMIKEKLGARLVLYLCTTQTNTMQGKSNAPGHMHFLSAIMAKYRCDNHNHECYVLSRKWPDCPLEVGTHVTIERDVLVDWAKDCV